MQLLKKKEKKEAKGKKDKGKRKAEVEPERAGLEVGPEGVWEGGESSRQKQGWPREDWGREGLGDCQLATGVTCDWWLVSWLLCLGRALDFLAYELRVYN